MDSTDHARLELMLHRGVEPLRGFVRESESREWRAFTGWLGLARELEQACDGSGADAAASRAGSTLSPERRAARPET